ncbi:MAG: hypothetical protein KKA42_07885 [candidate division Zixibacteria bacterium]|nr:hypothetical protein [candidate division Zixibacteria bacterium]
MQHDSSLLFLGCLMMLSAFACSALKAFVQKYWQKAWGKLGELRDSPRIPFRPPYSKLRWLAVPCIIAIEVMFRLTQ